MKLKELQQISDRLDEFGFPLAIWPKGKGERHVYKITGLKHDSDVERVLLVLKEFGLDDFFVGQAQEN